MNSTLLDNCRTTTSAATFSAKTFDALNTNIAILDESGMIIGVNLAWSRHASANDLPIEACGPGVNYLKICDAARGKGAAEAHAVADGIRQVNGWKIPEFYLEYPDRRPDGEHWYALRVSRFMIDETMRVVVAHNDITADKLATQDA